jgi:hypothetical protein
LKVKPISKYLAVPLVNDMSSGDPKTWFSIINESVHTSDDVDIGDIDALNKNFVVVKRGFKNVHYYYIPVSRVEGWDGRILWLKLTESQVKNNYERNVEPDPFIYFVKEHKEYFMPIALPVIHPKGLEQRSKVKPEDYVPHLYNCPLCSEVFRNEDELTKHLELVKH